MRNETERTLSGLTPRGAPATLRDRVLTAVAEELASETRHDPNWERGLGLLTAAALLLGIALNVWTDQQNRTALARLSGPRPIPQAVVETAEAIEAVAGAEAAHWARKRLLATRPVPLTRRQLDEQQLIQHDLIMRAIVEWESDALTLPANHRRDPIHSDRGAMRWRESANS